MKPVLLVVVVFGLAQAAITPSDSIKNDVKKIIDEFPLTSVIEIIQNCINNPEVHNIVQFVKELRSTKQVQNFRSDLVRAGILNDQLSELITIKNLRGDSNSSKTCGGWKSVREQIIKIFLSSELGFKFVDLYLKNKEFAKAWDVIREAHKGPMTDMLREPNVVAAIKNCTGCGVDEQLMKEYIDLLFEFNDE